MPGVLSARIGPANCTRLGATCAVGKVAKNHWSIVGDIDLYPGIISASYVPSDK